MKGHEHLTAAKALLVEAQRTYANMPEASLARMTEVSVLQGLAMAHTRVADLCFQIDRAFGTHTEGLHGEEWEAVARK